MRLKAFISGVIGREVNEIYSNKNFEIKNTDMDANRISKEVANFLFKVVDINTFKNSSIQRQSQNNKIQNYE